MRKEKSKRDADQRKMDERERKEKREGMRLRGK